MHRTFIALFLFSLICNCLYAAESVSPAPVPVPIEEEALPVSPSRDISSLLLDAQMKTLHHPRTYPGCKVAPLSEIWDPVALEFENNADTAPVDVNDLTPDAAQALNAFEGMVTSLGGTFELKSAYRPPAYQAHLHEVWVKWVRQLRGNHSSACRALREEVGAEFARHQLLVRQQPVPASDHELGLAFDAAVAMPRAARLNGKRVTVDRLAAMVGIKRPSIRRDPVHFKLLPEHPAAASSARTLSF
ncbi:MAG TPA: hypothetical protein VHC90_19380 [Bryobacteraceae bacterium]|nr:hypothetical protein [Bryobacteraceae bacterium]